MKAFVEIRSQSPVGTWPKQGPDTYVMVQVVSPNIEKLKVLNKKVAQKRGIKLIHCGEGYYNRQATTQSMLGSAIEKATQLADKINKEQKIPC